MVIYWTKPPIEDVDDPKYAGAGAVPCDWRGAAPIEDAVQRLIENGDHC